MNIEREVRTADRLGIPYFALLFFGIILLIVTIKLDLSKQTSHAIFLMYSISITTWFGFKLFQERRQVSKLRKELHDDKN